jgi:hypothetical protein
MPLVVVDERQLVRKQYNEIQNVRYIVFGCWTWVRDDDIDVVRKHSRPLPNKPPLFFLLSNTHRSELHRSIQKLGKDIFGGFVHHSILLERSNQEVGTQLLVVPAKQSVTFSNNMILI